MQGITVGAYFGDGESAGRLAETHSAYFKGEFAVPLTATMIANTTAKTTGGTTAVAMTTEAATTTSSRNT